MITKQRALFYFVGDKAFKDVAEAQEYDLQQLAVKNPIAVDWSQENRCQVVKWLMANATEIVDILTTTPTSRLKARKTHGGTKVTRKPKLKPVVETKL